MSIASFFDSEFLYCNNVINEFGVENERSSYQFRPPQRQRLEDPPTYNVRHASGCDLVGRRSYETPPGHHGLSNCHPADCQSCDGLPGGVPADKRNHKMIERQRRREMNVLFSMLRSLLPDESLRGKRTVSDQVQVAVAYIRHLQQKIEDLLTERERIKADSYQNTKVSFEVVGLPCNENLIYTKDSPIEGSDPQFPTVQIKSKGSAVHVLTNTFEHQIAYSDLLQALEERGLEIVGAASSAINNRVYHTIHSKASDLSTINIDTLYEKLWHLIKDSPHSGSGFRDC